MKVLYSADLREYSNEELMCTLSERAADEANPNISFDDFVRSLSPAKKKFALSVIELYKRDVHSKKEVTTITGSESIYRIMYPHLYGLQVEEMWAIFLNTAGRPLKAQRFFQGGHSFTAADPRVIMKEALLCCAASVIVCHNHPSLSRKPSLDDDRTTDKLKKICDACGIRFLDHLIFAGDEYYSYSDEGRI